MIYDNMAQKILIVIIFRATTTVLILKYMFQQSFVIFSLKFKMKTVVIAVKIITRLLLSRPLIVLELNWYTVQADISCFRGYGQKLAAYPPGGGGRGSGLKPRNNASK